MAHPHYDDMDSNSTFVSLLLLCNNFFRNFLVLQKKFHKRWNFMLPKINFTNKEEKIQIYTKFRETNFLIFLHLIFYHIRRYLIIEMQLKYFHILVLFIF